MKDKDLFSKYYILLLLGYSFEDSMSEDDELDEDMII